MSLPSFKQLKGMTTFNDIEFICTKACRQAIDIHPTFENDKRNNYSFQREEDPYDRLYCDGNVVKVFKHGRKICGNFELAGRWEKDNDVLLYLNVFEIDHEEDPIEINQTSRYQIRVSKKINDNVSEEITVYRGNGPRPKKEKPRGIGKYVFAVALSGIGLFVAKKQFLDGGLFNSPADTIENTFERASEVLNVAK